MLELTEKILTMMGRSDLRPTIQNIASAEIREQYASVEKAKTRLGWEPKYGMEEGLRRTIAWYTQHFQDEALRALDSKLAAVK